MSKTTPNTQRHPDKRVDTVDVVKINWDDFKTAFKRNYLTDYDKQHNGHTYLRLSPGTSPAFSNRMQATPHFSHPGRFYDPGFEPKPIHIHPHLIIETGREKGVRDLLKWPEEWDVEQNLTEAEIEEEGGIDAALATAREIFWDDLQLNLPETFDLGKAVSPHSKHVDIEWQFENTE